MATSRRGPPSTPPGPAGTRVSTEVIAADGGYARALRASGSCRRSSWATSTRWSPSLVEAAEARRRRDPALARREGRVATPSSRCSRRSAAARPASPCSARSAARASTTRSPTSGCSATRRSRGSSSVLLDATHACVAAHRARSGRGAGPAAAPRAAAGRRSRCFRSAATSTGVTTQRLRYPLRDEPLVARARARPLQRPRGRRTPRSRVRARPAPRHRDRPVTSGLSSAMSIPQPGDPAPRVALPDETGTDPPPVRPTRLAGPSSTSTPRTTRPGCTTEACQFRDLHATSRAPTRRSGASAPTASGAHAAFRAKYGLPFTLLSDEDHAVAEAYGAWREKTNYGKTYMGIGRSSFLVGPDGRVARTWAERQGRRSRRAGPARRARVDGTAPRRARFAGGVTREAAANSNPGAQPVPARRRPAATSDAPRPMPGARPGSW